VLGRILLLEENNGSDLGSTFKPRRERKTAANGDKERNDVG